MSFKITKARQHQIDALKLSLARAHVDAERAIDEYNAIVGAAYDKLQAAIQKYNSYVDDSVTLLEEIHGELLDEFNEKSDKWQESPRGEATLDWIEAIGHIADFELKEAEIPDFEEIDGDDIFSGTDPVDVLDDLSAEPDYETI